MLQSHLAFDMIEILCSSDTKYIRQWFMVRTFIGWEKVKSIRNYLASEVISDGIYEIYPSELRRYDITNKRFQSRRLNI